MTLRFKPQIELAIAEAAKKRGVSKSEYVRSCVTADLEQNAAPTVWELSHELCGKFGSGRSDLSTNAEQIVREMINARHRRS
jgi:hypothetical protein